MRATQQTKILSEITRIVKENNISKSIKLELLKAIYESEKY